MKMNSILKSMGTLLILVSLGQSAQAQSATGVPIIGDSYGTFSGLIHWNHSTARYPSDPGFTPDDSNYKGGVRQFYIDDSWPAAYFPGYDGDTDVVANISTDAGECSTPGDCPIKGFLWADRIGWIAMDGKWLESIITGPGYDSTMYPFIRSSSSSATPDRIPFTGIGWNRETGWLMLSANLTNGTVTSPSSQNKDDFGIYLDTSASPSTLHGFMWSEKLGWISAHWETGYQIDTDGPTGSIYGPWTDWQPDSTPPDILLVDNAWFAVGKNTGSTPTSTVEFDIAEDLESGINETISNITVRELDGDGSCQEPAPGTVLIQANGLRGKLIIPVIYNLNNVTKGYCKYEIDGEIRNNANLPNDPSEFPKTIYVRAGDVDSTVSNVVPPISSVIADGGNSTNSFANYSIELKDLAGNPIIDVNCSSEPTCSSRVVAVDADFTNTLDYDMLGFTQDGASSPVYIDGLPLDYSDTNININRVNFAFPVSVTSYAPNNSYDVPSNQPKNRSFRFESINYNHKDDALQAVLTDGTTGYFDPQDIDGVAANSLAQINFVPPVFANNASVITDGNPDVIELTKQSNLSYDLNNISDARLANANDNSELSIDYVFQYESPSGNTDIIFVRTESIQTGQPGGTPLDAHADEDSILAWEDPFEFECWQNEDCPRYEIYHGRSPNNIALEPDTTFFNNFYDSYHTTLGLPSNRFFYWRENGPPTRRIDIPNGPCISVPSGPNTIKPSGQYYVTGNQQIPQVFAPCGNPNNYADWPEGVIDRNDKISSLSLASTHVERMEIQFTPNQICPSCTPANDSTLALFQEFAYRYAGQPTRTRFAQSALVDGYQLIAEGLEARGTVAGDELVTDRRFEVIGTEGVARLKEQVRRNVAQMTQGLTPCGISGGELRVSSISNDPNDPSGCIFQGENGTFAYYSSPFTDDNLVLEGNLRAPDGPHTIILTGGANLVIRDDIYYEDKNASLGIIVLANPASIGQGDNSIPARGHGANIYLDPSVSHVAAVAYIEGTIQSFDLGSFSYYYGSGSGNPSNLTNQLFWQGSIASENTIGGADATPLRFPNAMENNLTKYCYGSESNEECAKRYDLDYLRQFAVSQPAPGQTITAGEFGDGCSCSGICGACNSAVFEDHDAFPTNRISLIKLNGNQLDLNDPYSITASVYVEPHPNSSQNPPPGLSVFEGFDITPVIR